MHGRNYHIHTVLLFVAAFGVGGCAEPSESATGTLTLNLAMALPDGDTYRLRDATITITGPDSVQVFRTEDLPDRSSLSANVPVGAYSALLEPGWRLERLRQFSQSTVNAELASDNPLHFRVEFEQRTVVPLRFRTNIGEIDLSQGYDIVLDVEEVAVRGVVVSNFSAEGAASGLAVFAPNADGNTPPLRTIDGIEASLINATGIAVAGDEIIVVDQFYPAINVFPRDSSGRLEQPRRIASISNGILIPNAIAVYQGEMYVADLGKVLVFPLAGTDDVAPTRIITDLAPASQIAIDRDTGELYVPEGSSGVVRVFSASASGPATAIRTIGGPRTGFVAPSGIAVFDGHLFVSDAQTGDIRVFALFAAGDVAPLRVIKTARNGIGSLGHLSVARDEIYAVNKVTRTVDVFPINATGAIAPTRSFAGSTPGAPPFEPFGVAVF